MYGYLWVIAAFLFGLVIGCCIAKKQKKRNQLIGTLKIDSSDPIDGPYIFLEMKKDAFKKLKNFKYVLVNVDFVNYLSDNGGDDPNTRFSHK